jgi:spore coat polysaccharide biosynthesis protein SpsF
LNSRISNHCKTERAVAFVVVRLSSSRFPAKQLRHIGNKPILNWTIDHLRQSSELDEIVITTVAETANEPLKAFAKQENLACFWYEGEVDHVTTRLRRAAETYRADICVLISGDCPLIHAPSIDQMIKTLKNTPEADVIGAASDEDGRVAALEGISLARLNAWQRADDLSDRPELKEHQFPVIGQHPHLFKKITCRLSRSVYTSLRHRLSVDTWADMAFMNTLHDALNHESHPFDLPHAVDLLRQQPELHQINAHVHQRQLIEDIKRILFIVDAGAEFGYDQLLRCRQFALQIVEQLSFPVTFMVDDERAAELIKERGFRVIRGAWERPVRSPHPFGQDENISNKQMDSHDLILLSIHHGRKNITTGWRKQFQQAKPFIVLDNISEWTNEADFIIKIKNTNSSQKDQNIIRQTSYFNDEYQNAVHKLAMLLHSLPCDTDV